MRKLECVNREKFCDELYKLIIMGGYVLCNIHFFRYECKLVWKKIPENATLISVKNGRMRNYEQRSSKTGFCSIYGAL